MTIIWWYDHGELDQIDAPRTIAENFCNGAEIMELSLDRFPFGLSLIKRPTIFGFLLRQMINKAINAPVYHAIIWHQEVEACGEYTEKQDREIYLPSTTKNVWYHKYQKGKAEGSQRGPIGVYD